MERDNTIASHLKKIYYCISKKKINAGYNRNRNRFLCGSGNNRHFETNPSLIDSGRMFAIIIITTKSKTIYDNVAYGSAVNIMYILT